MSVDGKSPPVTQPSACLSVRPSTRPINQLRLLVIWSNSVCFTPQTQSVLIIVAKLKLFLFGLFGGFNVWRSFLGSSVRNGALMTLCFMFCGRRQVQKTGKRLTRSPLTIRASASNCSALCAELKMKGSKELHCNSGRCSEKVPVSPHNVLCRQTFLSASLFLFQREIQRNALRHERVLTNKLEVYHYFEIPRSECMKPAP